MRALHARARPQTLAAGCRQRTALPSVTRQRTAGRQCKSRAQDHGEATYSDLEKISVDLSAFNGVGFFKVTAILRPWRLPDVVKALNDIGVRGLTVSDCSGIGFQGGKERYAGTEFGEADLIEKKKLEVVSVRGQVNAVCRCISVASFTGEIGDGKIFVEPVADIIRIRTAETGGSAERMVGGRQDLLSKST